MKTRNGKTGFAESAYDRDELVASGDGRSTGFLSVKKVAGTFGFLGDVKAPDVLPPLVGGSATILTTLLIRKFAKNSPRASAYAPLIAIPVGILASAPLAWWGKGGRKAMISGSLTAAVVGVGVFAFEKATASAWMTSGMGLISAQKRPAPKMLRGPVFERGGKMLPQASTVPASVRRATNTGMYKQAWQK